MPESDFTSCEELAAPNDAFAPDQDGPAARGQPLSNEASELNPADANPFRVGMLGTGARIAASLPLAMPSRARWISRL